jgi:hypothetical protein
MFFSTCNTAGKKIAEEINERCKIGSLRETYHSESEEEVKWY